jgi:hypothetical protein
MILIDNTDNKSILGYLSLDKIKKLHYVDFQVLILTHINSSKPQVQSKSMEKMLHTNVILKKDKVVLQFSLEIILWK